MAFNALHRQVVRRLDQGDRGDRGWFIITRVHLTAARLAGSCQYLDAAGARRPYALTDGDYAALARINEVSAEDPGLSLRRHYLLAMESPLHLLRRSDGRR